MIIGNYYIKKEWSNNTMKTILHLSDLHITSDMQEPENNTFITTLIKKIKSKHIIDILIFTGDLIDSKSISKKITLAPSNHKEKLWNEEATMAFDLGKKYLKYIKEQLNIPDTNIIICVGNHDVNRNSTTEEEKLCDKEESLTFTKRFDMYRKFSDDFLPFKDSYKTYFKTVEGFNFLVVNSNWNNGNNGQMCINCNEINDIVTNNISQLSSSNKKQNIFISHSPVSDFCEEARYGYKENNYKPIKQILDEYFDIYIAGDKHTDTFDHHELIVGAPTTDNKTSCGIYEYTDDQLSVKHLLYKNLKWETECDTQLIQSFGKISEKFLKQSCIEVLYNEKLDIAKMITNNQEIYNQQMILFNKLFRSYTTLKKTKYGNSGENVTMSENIIEQTQQLINDSIKQYPLMLRGMPKLGKSLFLTLLYLHLLHSSVKDEFDYIPVYFNLDAVLLEQDNNWSNIKSTIDSIFRDSSVLSKKHYKPICFIFDGLNKYKFYKTSIEDYIQTKITQNQTYTKHKNKFVICFDTDEDLGLHETEMNRTVDAEYVLYFNSIIINNTYSNSNYINFIFAFSNLYSNVKEEIIFNNIKKLNLNRIDLNTLLNFKEYFTSIDNSNCCITELYNKLAIKLIDNSYIASACTACYKLYYEQKTFEQINNDKCNINYQVFEILKKQKNLAMYLIARYYVNALKTANSSKKPNISPILNECFSYEISNFVRGIIIKDNLLSELKSFNNKFYNVLDCKGRAMLTYFIGRMKLQDRELSSILYNQENLLQNYKSSDTEDEFFLKVAQRSIIISRITGLSSSEEHLDHYIMQLLQNESIRYVNREFYLLYYGDRKINEINFNYIDTLYEGFDFYNVFHVIATKLRIWKENSTPYNLLKLEIFTLCDLLQQRLDNINACSRNNRSNQFEYVKSFFYNEKYAIQSANALKFAISIIEKYLKESHKDSIFSSYLKTKHNEFNIALSTINEDKDITETTFCPSEIFYDCAQISKVEKIGWKIKDNLRLINDDMYDNVSHKKNYENVVEHIYECYLIGLLYLPKTIPSENEYNKQDILNMLLIHDLGESKVKDYPPYYININQKKEEENLYNEKLFLSGLHNGISDLTEQFHLWNLWYENDKNINIQIAKDIDKIHLIYKMFILLSETDISLNDDRIKSILKERKNIKTKYGNIIYQTLIEHNHHIRDDYKQLLL